MAYLAHSLSVGVQCIHAMGEIIVAADFNTTTRTLQALSLLELLIIGAEEYRHPPDSGFNDIVNANAEATTH